MRRGNWTYRARKVVTTLSVTVMVILGLVFASGAVAESNLSAGPDTTPPFISPNGDGFFESCTISYTLVSDGYVSLRIYSNSYNTLQRNLLTSAFQLSGERRDVWGDLNAQDGVYYPRLDGISYRANLTGTTFSTPSQIAVDPTRRHPTSGVIGNYPVIYVADTANNALKWTADNGATWSSITGIGNIHGVAVLTVDTYGYGPSGTKVLGFPSSYPANTTTIWLTSETNGPEGASLYGYRWNGTALSLTYNLKRKNEDRLRQISIDPQGSIYVTEVSVDRLMKIFWDESLAVPGWSRGWSGFPFVDPYGVYAESTGTLYVADSTTSAANLVAGRIWKSTDAGNSFSEFSTGGVANGQVTTPRGLYGENGRLWCADAGNNRVQQFWSDGTWIQAIKGTGNYSLTTPRGIAYDNAGGLYVVDTGVNTVRKYIRDNILGSGVMVDNTKPVSYQISSITSPSEDIYFQKGTITVNATAIDNVGGAGIGRVEFYRAKDGNWGTAVHSVDTIAPYQDIWTTTAADDGNYQYMIYVFDNVENYQTSAVSAICVDNTPPVAKFDNPLSGAFVRGNLAITGDSTDLNHAQYLLEYLDGTWKTVSFNVVPVQNALLGTWNTAGLTGPYTLRLTNRDKAGNTASESVTYSVDNVAPVISVSDPGNSPFSPNASPGVKDTSAFTITATDNNSFDAVCNWTFEVKTTTGTHIWSVTGAGSPPATVVWNGKDDGGAYVADATYNYYFTIADRAGNSTTTAAKQVVIDNIVPAAAVGAASQDPFSPGGAKPTTGFSLTGTDASAIATWNLAVDNAAGTAIRTTSGSGNPPADFTWDGKDGAGSTVADGTYSYSLGILDAAGNRVSSAYRTVLVDTAGPLVTASDATVNPFGGATKPSTIVNLTATDANGFDANCNWSLVFNGATHTKTFSGTGAPSSYKEWLADKDGGGLAADGTYTYSFSVTDKAGNQAATAPKTVVLDKTAPVVSQGNASVDPFSPNSSAGIKDSTDISLTASDANGFDGSCSWSLTFKNSAQTPVRTYSGTGAPPASRMWNGTYDDDITYVPDGQYSHLLSVTDKAGNTASTAIKYVNVDNTAPAAAVGAASQDPFSPGGAKPTTGFSLTGTDSTPGIIASWNLAIEDSVGNVVRSTSNSGTTPASFVWDGRNDAASYVSDGTYSYSIRVTDNAGNPVSSSYHTVSVDRTAPAASVGAASPTPFSPNNDGIKDSINFDVTASDVYGFDNTCNWTLVFHNGTATKTYSGTADPSGTRTWDGSKDGGGTASSGTYSYELTLADKAGNMSTSMTRLVALDITPPAVSAGACTPGAFSNSAAGTTTNVINVSDTFGFDASCLWQMVYKNAAGATVRTITGSNAPASVQWDGRYDSGVLCPEDTYSAIFTIKDISGNPGSSSPQTVVIDNSPPIVNAADALPAKFSPNGDGDQDTTTLGFSASDSSGIVSWSVRIYTSSFNAPVRSTSGTGSMTDWSFVWDGRNNVGTIVPDGNYKYAIRATNGANLVSVSTPERVVMIDTIPPTATITNPSNGSVQGGVVDIRGTAWDANFQDYSVEYKGAASVAWSSLVTNSTPVIGDSLYAWNTKTGAKAVADGDYIIRLTARDGGSNTVATAGFTVDNVPPIVIFGAPTPGVISPQLSPGVQDTASATVNITEAHPFGSWVLDIRPVGSTGYVKRTTGTNNPVSPVSWNGLDGGGSQVPEGNYRFVLDISDQGGNAATAQSADIIVDHTAPSASLGAANPASFSPNSDGVKDTTDIPLGASDANSIAFWKLEIKKGVVVHRTVTGAGGTPLKFTWDGRNDAGAYVPEDIYTYSLTATDTAGTTTTVNGPATILVDFTKPVIAAPTVSPAQFSPTTSVGLKDTTTIAASVTDASAFDWTVKIYNPGGELSRQFSGTGTTIDLLWDGKNESGNVVADGVYLVKVDATDIAGNAAVQKQTTVIVDDTYPVSTVGDASNPYFSPNGDGIKDDTTMPLIATDANGFADWRLDIRNWNDVIVRTTSGLGAPPADFVWNGYNDVGGLVLSGTYGYSLTVTDPSDNETTSSPKFVVSDTGGPTSENPTSSYVAFSPRGVRADSSVANGNGHPGVTLSAVAFDPLSTFHWYMTISRGGVVYRSFDAASGTRNITINQPWDGKDDSGKVVPDGVYDYKIKCLDDAANWGNQITGQVTVDTTYADIGIATPAQDDIIRNHVSVVGTAQDTNFSRYEIWVGEGTSPQVWSVVPLTTSISYSQKVGQEMTVWDTTQHLTDPTKITTDGIYVIRLRATDQAENSIELNRLVNIRNAVIQSDIYPIPCVDDGAGNKYVSGIVTIVGSANNSGLTRFQGFDVDCLRAGTTIWQPIAYGSMPVSNSTLATWRTGLSGLHTVRLRVRDIGGNVAMTSAYINVDNDRPVISTLTPASGATVTSQLCTVAATVSDNSIISTSASELRLDGLVVPFSYVNGRFHYAPSGGIADGKHTARLTLKDLVGNTSIKEWSFTADHIAPTVNIDGPESGERVNGATVVTGSVYDNVTLRSYMLQVKAADVQDDAWTSFIYLTPVIDGNMATWMAPTVITSTAYDIRIVATDLAGNVTTSPVRTFWVSPVGGQPAGQITKIGGYTLAELAAGATIKGSAGIAVNGSAPKTYNVRYIQTYPVTSAYVYMGTVLNKTTKGTLVRWNTSRLNGRFNVELHESASSSTPLQTVSNVRVDSKPPQIFATLNTYGPTTLQKSSLAEVFAKGYDPEPYYWVTGAYTSSNVSTTSIEMKVDGETVPVSYDFVPADRSGTKRITYRPTSGIDPADPFDGGFANGTHYVTLKVADTAGNYISKSWNFQTETGDSLTAAITRLADGASVSGVYKLTGLARGRNFSRFVVDYYLRDDPLNRRIPTWVPVTTNRLAVNAVDGTLATWNTRRLNGWVKLRLRAYDLAGNVVTYGPIQIQCDNKAPNVGSVAGDFSPANLAYVNSSGYSGKIEVFNVFDQPDLFYKSGSGLNASRIEMTLNGIHVIPSFDALSDTVYYKPEGAFAAPDGGLADGYYNVVLTVCDNVGNSKTKNWSFTVDNTSPTASLSYPDGAAPLTGGKVISIIGTASDTNISTYNIYTKLSVDDDDLFTLLFSTPSKNVVAADGADGKLGQWYLPRIDGNYDIRLEVIDKAGNARNVYRRNLAISLTANAVPISLANLVTPSKPILRGTVPLKGTISAPGMTSYQLIITPITAGTLLLPVTVNGRTAIYNGDLALWWTPRVAESFKVELKALDSLGVEITGLPGTNSIAELKVDNVAPVLASVFPANRSYINPDTLPSQYMTLAFNENSGMDTTSFTLVADGQNVPFDWSPSGNAHIDSSGTYVTINPDPTMTLEDGVHYFVLNAKDKAGNAMRQRSWYFTIDSNRPYPGSGSMVPITAAASMNVVSGSYAGGVVSIYGRAFDQTISKFVIALYDQGNNFVQTVNTSYRSVIDAGLGRFASTALNGFYQLVMTLTDRAGNVLTDRVGINLDNVKPVATITSPVYGGTLSGSITVQGTASDSNISSYAVELGLGAVPATWTVVGSGTSSVTGATLATFDSSTFADGAYTMRLTVLDRANNKTVVLLPALIVENAAPTTVLTAPTDGAWVSGKYAIRGTVRDPYLLTRVITMSRVISTSPLSLGPPVIYPAANSVTNGVLFTWDTTTVTAGAMFRLAMSGTDKYGHVSPTITVNVSVDNTKPSISTLSPAPGSSGASPAEISAVLDDSMSGIDLASVAMTVDGLTVSPGSVTANGSQYTVRYAPPVLAAGNHTVSFRFSDAAGNWVSRSWIFEVQ